MTTHIVKSPQFTMLIADNNDALVDGFGGDVVAWLLDITNPASEMPSLVEEFSFFDFKKFGI